MVYQSQKEGCGKACVRNVLYLLSRESRYRIYPLEEDLNDFSSIKKALIEEGARYEGYEVYSLHEVKKDSLPAIAQMEFDGVSHFVVLLKVTNKYVFLLDPEFGERKMKKNEFLSSCTGKMLLRQSYEKKNGTKISLLRFSERMVYLLLFLAETLALEVTLFFAPQENGFPYAIIAGVIFFILILLQNAFNYRLEGRLEKEILLPYMEKRGKEEDFAALSRLFSKRIEEESSMVSYGVLSVSLLTVLLYNASYLSFLALIAFFFSLLRLLFEKGKGRVEATCSYQERIFLKKRNQEKEEAEIAYYKAKDEARKYLFISLFLWVMEALVLVIFSAAILSIDKTFELNTFLFLIGCSLSFSFAVEKFAGVYHTREEEIVLCNSLSYPLPWFLLKRNRDLDYTKGTSSEGGEPDGRKTHTGLSRPDRGEEGV